MILSKMSFSILKDRIPNRKMVSKLTDSSTYRIHVKCDDCGCKFKTIWNARFRRIKDGKNDLCKNCKFKGKRNPSFGQNRRDILIYARSFATSKSMSRNFTPEQRNNISKSLIGRKQKKETIERRRIALLGRNPFLNKKHTVETKKIIRLKFIERLEKKHGKFNVNYNENACYIFNHVNSIFNIDGLHALNKGEFKVEELGYYLDFYEPSLNLVIEYYEKRHFSQKKILKDAIREKEIINHLNCKFLVISYNDSLEKIMKNIAKIIKND